LKAREGELVENSTGVIFDVKGLVHPPEKIVAFPRFVPDRLGKRHNEGRDSSKIYPLNERFSFLRQNFTHYLVHDSIFDEVVCEVPVEDIVRHYIPAERLAQLRKRGNLSEVEQKALRLAEMLQSEAAIPWSTIGISGSILAGLFTSASDIDPVVYGAENCRRVYSALERFLRDGSSAFRRYDRGELEALFEFRSRDTAMAFEDFVRIESKKVIQGKFMGTDYFMRFVKDWNEVGEEYGERRYRNAGRVKVKAVVANHGEAIFTPCTYGVKNVEVLDGPTANPIAEIASFRGRFCEQAAAGETVVAEGKLEHVNDLRRSREFFRVLVGGSPTDFMIST